MTREEALTKMDKLIYVCRTTFKQPSLYPWWIRIKIDDLMQMVADELEEIRKAL